MKQWKPIKNQLADLCIHLSKILHISAKPIEIDGWRITAYYYLTSDDIDNIDSYDWESSVEFEAEEIF